MCESAKVYHLSKIERFINFKNHSTSMAEITKSQAEERSALVTEYNRIPKTAPHDARRKAAFDKLMKFEEKLLNGTVYN